MKLEDSQTLMATGPGTPMGELFRSYWLPGMPSSDLVLGPTLRRIELLGEQLVADRPASGKVALLEELCAHRGASLSYGSCDTTATRWPIRRRAPGSDLSGGMPRPSGGPT